MCPLIHIIFKRNLLMTSYKIEIKAISFFIWYENVTFLF